MEKGVGRACLTGSGLHASNRGVREWRRSGAGATTTGGRWNRNGTGSLNGRPTGPSTPRLTGAPHAPPSLPLTRSVAIRAAPPGPPTATMRYRVTPAERNTGATYAPTAVRTIAARPLPAMVPSGTQDDDFEFHKKPRDACHTSRENRDREDHRPPGGAATFLGVASVQGHAASGRTFSCTRMNREFE